MRSFRDQPFAHRLGKMGDAAEGVFESTYPEGWASYGLRRPPINLSTVPPVIRYTPDYVTGKGLVEVQGFGADQTCKLKVEKFDAMRQWHDWFRTDMFLWDSHNKRYGWVRMIQLHDLIDGGSPQVEEFPEGKAYYAIPAERLPVVEWINFEATSATA